MVANAGDFPAYTKKSAKRDRYTFIADQAIGAAGAVGTLTADDPGITVAKNAGAGTYDITFPKCLAARIFATLVSAAGTVKITNLATISATAGTAQLITSAPGGAATNPANGDVIQLQFELDTRTDN